MRESKESPRLKAFCRVAPSVLFNDRAIFPAGVLFRASAFNVRTCSDVHARRFPFRLAIISPSGQSAALCSGTKHKRKDKLSDRIERGCLLSRALMNIASISGLRGGAPFT
jgi:hypothetical protein